MAKIKNPVLFSRYYGVDPDALDAAGLIDPFVDVDTQLFIDPVLLEKSETRYICEIAHQMFRAHFSNFVRLLSISRAEGDAAWRAARQLLCLQEPPENGLGYGGSGRSGSSRPDQIREKMMRTASEIIQLGADDPEMISLMAFFEEDIGPDTISDFTTRVILPALAQLTEEFCIAQNVPVAKTAASPDHRLPTFIDAAGWTKPLLLVPSDIVRELPVANDWSDIEAAVSENERIRARVNVMLAGIARPTISDRKHALRRAALASSDDFQAFLHAVKAHTTFYDKNVDALGYYRLRAIFSKGIDGLPTGNAYHFAAGPEEIKRLVHDTLEIFRHHVENGNLWEELWIGDKPKKERAAQLIYYAIADCYCKANNVDISPEANMGGGPVDFKFSQGYEARVLVEMKRSSGTVRHGYERQLEIYRDASRTNHGIFVVMDFGDVGEKLTQINQIRSARIAAGEQASDIVVIDATRKASASRRH